jgi:hypothetical protein
MTLPFCIQIGRMRGFCGVEVTDEVVFPVVVNPRGPTLHRFAPRRTEKSAAAVRACSAFILLVGRTRHIAQIFKTIVCAISVYVINVVSGPFPMNHRPHSSVRLDGSTSGVNPRVSIRSLVPYAFKQLACFRVATVVTQQRLKNVFLSQFKPHQGASRVGADQGDDESPFRPLKLGQHANLKGKPS